RRMSLITRRKMLKSAALPIAGTFALPSLAAAVQEVSTPYQRPKLKITDVRTAQGRVQGLQTHIRVDTDQGLYGQGESTDAAVGTVSLVNQFRRFLVGQDPLNVDALWERIRTSGIFAGAQGGQYTTALTAVESALWDLAGKALGLPVYQLLGGKFRDKIRVYCDTALYRADSPPPEKFAAAATEAVKMGFTAVKFDIDEARDPNKYDAYNWTASPAELDRMYN